MQNEQCPLCGEWNETQNTHCGRCRYRLPWADALEGVPREAPPDETQFERELKTMGLLPQQVTCRYCNGPIEVHDKQCPHCERWLNSYVRSGRMDLVRVKDTEQVDIMGPKTGFAAAISTLIFGVLALLALAAVCWLLVKFVP